MTVNLKLVRTVTFGAATFLSVILLGLGAYLVNLYLGLLDFANLAVAAGVLTLVTLPAMYAIELKRPGTPLGWVALEVGWINVLWVLWLACAARAADVYGALNRAKTAYRGSRYSFRALSLSDYEDSPNVMAAIVALGFIIWLLLIGYVALLTMSAVKASQNGNTAVWKQSVDALASATPQEKGGEAGSTHPGMHQYPPQ